MFFYLFSIDETSVFFILFYTLRMNRKALYLVKHHWHEEEELLLVLRLLGWCDDHCLLWAGEVQDDVLRFHDAQEFEQERAFETNLKVVAVAVAVDKFFG